MLFLLFIKLRQTGEIWANFICNDRNCFLIHNLDGLRHGKDVTKSRTIFAIARFHCGLNIRTSISYLKEGVSLHSSPKVRFREYFIYFLMRQNLKKIDHSEGAENIDFTYQ